MTPPDVRRERLERLEDQCRALAARIKALLPDDAGFALVLYDRDDPGSITYVTAAGRDELIGVLQAVIDRLARERS